MEPQFINFSQLPIPSLKNVAILKIVTSLLTQLDVEIELKKLMKKVQDTERRRHIVGYYNFCEIRKIIQSKLTLLCIPQNLQNEILNFAKPIGLQITKCFDERTWEYYHLYNLISKEVFYWTFWGTIDKTKSLEQAVFRNYTAFSPECQETLFEFACHYCLENCIFELWNKMTENQKDKFRYEDTNFKISRLYIDSNLIYYWVSLLENRFISFCESHNFNQRKHSTPRSMLKLAISSKSFLAVKYFWQKLLKKERTDQNIFDWLSDGVNEYRVGEWHGCGNIIWYDCQVSSECTDIILFLMSQLSDQNQQKKAFHTYPEIVLKSVYYHWPYSVYFLPTINQMWDCINQYLYIEMVTTIVTEAEKNASRVLLRELWSSTPENIKTRFLDPRNNRPDLLKDVKELGIR